MLKSKLKSYFALLSIMLLSAAGLWAQRQISGVVTDVETGEALIGASVRAVGATVGANTDFDGRFSFTIPEGVTQIEVSYTGYDTRTITLDASNEYAIALSSGVLLGEAIVVAYGTVRKEDVTGSLFAVTEKDFNKGAINSPQELLVGKVAGVQVTTNPDPGGGATIRIRGGSSLSASNDPLIIVDGVPLSNTGPGGARNVFNIINPNDIESFTVLKDASSTALYGLRASNGVIIITTKKGSLKRKLAVDYSNNFSFSTPANRIDVLSADEFRSIITSRYDDNHPSRQLLGSANTDWQDEIYQNAFGMDHTLALSGGIGSVPYRLSLGLTDRDGILKTDKFQRQSAALNLTPGFFNNYLQINTGIKVARNDNFFANRGAIGAAASFDPTQPVRDPNSPFGGYYTHLQNGVPNLLAPVNPVAQLNMQRDESEVMQYIANFTADYRFHFLPDLRANLNLALDRSSGSGSASAPVNYPGGFRLDDQGEPDGGFNREYTSIRNNKLLEFYLNYARSIGNSKLDIMGGYSWQHFYLEDESETVSARNTRVISPLILNKRENYLVSLFGRVNYNIADRVLLTFTLRRDGTSRFSPENRWGMFPSAAVAWRVIKDRAGDLNSIKLRASYGETGQQDIGGDYYPYLARYQFSTPTAQYQLGDEFLTTIRPNGYDRNIRWERTKTYNVGLDYAFFNNRVFGAIDYYVRPTIDLINFIPVAAGSNLTNFINTNVGDLENRGVELSITTVPVQSSRVNWEFGANFTANRNRITRLQATDDPSYRGVATGGISGGVGNTIQIHSVGYAANSFYVFEQVYDQSGKPIENLYVDRNGDGVITPEDQYRYKNPVANLLAGFYSNLTIGRFDFSTGFRASLGNYIYNNGEADRTWYNNLYQATGFLNNIQRGHESVGFNVPRYFSDHFVQDGSFLRFDHLTLGYSFGKMGFVRSLRIFGTAQNPFVITRYSGVDPEVFNGIDNNLYPRAVTYLFGLNASF